MHISFGDIDLIFLKISSSVRFSAAASKILGLRFTDLIDWANNSAQVGGSIAEYVSDNFW